MEAGPKLDALVAQHVMGWTEGNGYVVVHRPWGDYICHDSLENDLPPWSPSTDIAAAFEVLDAAVKQSEGWWRWELTQNLCRWYQSGQESEGQPFAWERGETTEHAICLAALKACGVKG